MTDFPEADFRAPSGHSSILLNSEFVYCLQTMSLPLGTKLGPVEIVAQGARRH